MKKKSTLLAFVLILGLCALGQPYHAHYLKQVITNSTVKFNASAYDKDGNFYVAGTFTDSALFDNGTLLLSNAQTEDIVIAKYNRQGHTVWAKKAGSSTFDAAQGIAVDGSSNVYVAGTSGAGATFGSLAPDNGSYSSNTGFIAKLDSNGNFIWVKGSVMVYPTTVYVDKDNKVFAGGYYSFSTGDPTSFAGDSIYNQLVGSNTAFLWKFDGNGAVLSRFEPHSGANFVYDINGDLQGNIVAVGQYWNELELDSGVVIPNPHNTNSNSESGFTVKFDNNLNPLWAKANWGISGSWYSVAVDSLNNIYAGGLYGDSLQIGSNTFLCPSYTNFIFAKYSANGILQWTKSYGNGEEGKIQYRLAYDKSNDKLWTTFHDAGSTGGDGLLTYNAGIANVDKANGNFINIVQSTTDAEAWPYGLAVWNKNVAVAGNYTNGFPGADLNLTLLNLQIPYIYNGPTYGFAFEFTDTTLTTGLVEMQIADVAVSLFPNPNTGSFTVLFDDASLLGAELNISNLLGDKIYEQRIESFRQQIMLNNLPKGLYLLNIYSETGKATRKIIIN